MKIMLSIAPWDLWQGEEDALYPLGQAYLGAILEKNNYGVELLNLTNSRWEDVKEEVTKKIQKEKPDVFGISILSNSRISALKLLKQVKETSPKTIIVAGGVHTTMLPEQILENYPVDFLVLGEGDLTFLELLNNIKKRKPNSSFKKIKGIVFKEGGKIIRTLPRERIQDLDSLPIPKHEFFAKTINKHGIAYLITSRGCPFNCAFCPSSVHWGRRIIQRSAKNVLKEIKFLLKKFPLIKEIHFSDDEFLCNNQRVIDLCKMMISENIKIKWRCLGRASSINEELIKWMKKAGCSEVVFGVESGSQRILDNIGKKVKVKQMVEAFEICKKYGLKTTCLTIVGLPGENRQSVNETIKFAKRVKQRTEPAILIVYPGTRVCELAKQKGLLTDDFWLKEGLPPLYTCEHSKLKLWWWSFKVGFITNIYADNGNLKELLQTKFLQKLTPHAFFRIIRRYVSDKS